MPHAEDLLRYNQMRERREPVHGLPGNRALAGVLVVVTQASTIAAVLYTANQEVAERAERNLAGAASVTEQLLKRAAIARNEARNTDLSVRTCPWTN